MIILNVSVLYTETQRHYIGDVTGRLLYVGLQFAPFSLKWIKSVYFSESLN